MQLQLLQPLPLKKPRGLAILVAGPYRSGTGDDPPPGGCGRATRPAGFPLARGSAGTALTAAMAGVGVPA